MATGVYTDGSTQDLTSLATWRSSNSTNCTVASGGLATGVRAGSATISATYGGRTGATLAAGTTQQLKLSARYSNSVSYDVTNLATFRSSVSSVASVTSTGSAERPSVLRADVKAQVYWGHSHSETTQDGVTTEGSNTFTATKASGLPFHQAGAIRAPVASIPARLGRLAHPS